ncbi:L-amino acid amidase [Grifola frondosa]|uniref:L-amino acid amidase n=1 Tax=Grifola frondosa TaxID=5627 RepID=A0A1C7LSK7_GRIFR|nr:L-amino acid amidase [Grifola frondosa]
MGSVLKCLGVHTDFNFLSRSWGGMFARHYIAIRRPAGLRHLIVASTSALMELCRMLLQHWNWEYLDAMQALYKTHVCSLDPWPELLLKPSQQGTKRPPLCAHSNLMVYRYVLTSFMDITYPTLLINAPTKDRIKR